MAQGYVFTSDTDTESIAHLIESIQQSERTGPVQDRAASLPRLVGAYVIAVVDHRHPGKVVVASEGSLRFITRAKPEVGVASTKGFTPQLAALFLVTQVVAKLHGPLPQADELSHLQSLRHPPVAVQRVLELEPHIEAWEHPIATHPMPCAWGAAGVGPLR